VYLQEAVDKAHSSATHESEVEVGEKMRRARESRGLSIRRLAELSHCSASSISQIERGIASPRLNTLLSIGSSLGMTVSQMMSDDVSLHAPLRLSERHPIVRNDRHREYVLTRRSTSNFEVFVIVLAPGGVTSPAQVVHGDSQELLLISRGVAVLEVGKESYELAVGDSMEYLSSTPHRVLNKEDAELEFLWVVSPPSFEERTIPGV